MKSAESLQLRRRLHERRGMTMPSGLMSRTPRAARVSSTRKGDTGSQNAASCERIASSTGSAAESCGSIEIHAENMEKVSSKSVAGANVDERRCATRSRAACAPKSAPAVPLTAWTSRSRTN
eukprot:Amastigsp_a510501_11.p2 type:complete len:122 gc:universal Amastigsp_a510501_11:759-394(-)